MISYEPQPMSSQAQLDRFAEGHLTDPRRFVNARIDTKRLGKIAGFDGTFYAGTYEGQVGKPPKPKSFAMYLAIAGGGRTIAMSATADNDAFSTLNPSIETIAQSITVKTGN